MTWTPSWVANDSDWFDVSGDRVGKRHALPLVARITNDRWDNTVGVCDRFDTRLDDGALGSFHGRGASRSFCSGPRRPPLARVTRMRDTIALRCEPLRRESSGASTLKRRSGLPKRSTRQSKSERGVVNERNVCSQSTRQRPLATASGAVRRARTLPPSIADSLPVALETARRSSRRSACAQVCYVLDTWLRHLRERFSRRQRAVCRLAQLLVAARRRFADSFAVWYRVSPGETALPFHRKRPAYEAPTKKTLKYCGDELDLKSRTLLDYHPVEVARQMALAARADFCARAAERACVVRLDEGRTRANARTSSASSNQFNRISRWVASEIVRITDDAQMRLSMLKRFIELAHCCRDVQNLHGMYAVHVGLNQWPCSSSRASGRSCRPSWRSATPSSTSSAIPSRTRP
jgi:hypothetical protein